MKNRVISIILPIIMLLSALGVLWLILSSAGALSDSIALPDMKPVLLGTLLAVFCAIFAVSIVSFFLLKNRGVVSNLSKKDSLTGLASVGKIEKFYNGYKNTYGNYVFLTYIGYDAKSVTKLFGASENEELQKSYATLISNACGTGGCEARISDGVFVLAESCRSVSQAQQNVNELLNRLNNYRTKKSEKNRAALSAGIFLCEENQGGFAQALENAKIAYQYAVDNQLPSLIFSKDLYMKSSAKNRLREKLSNAIEHNQFDMYLQFIHGVKENGFIGAEVLSRWNNPEEGLLLPGYYINDMQSVGLIEKFDMYVLENTCKLLQEWAKTELKKLYLSCNITRVTISSPYFKDAFKQILSKYSFEHQNLVLEITEDALGENIEAAKENIAACKENGVKIAIDDFGEGFTSVEDIENYSIDQLKIGRKAIVNAIKNKSLDSIDAIINLAHKDNIIVVCEGIETNEHSDIVKGLSSDYIQGYFYSYVFPIEEGKEHYFNSIKDFSAK